MWKLGHAILSELIPLTIKTASIVADVFDLRAYTNDYTVIVHSDSTNGADVTLGVVIQQSDTADFAAFTTLYTFPTVDNTAGGALQQYVFKAESARRYIRVIAGIVGTSPSFSVGITGLGTTKAR